MFTKSDAYRAANGVYFGSCDVQRERYSLEIIYTVNLSRRYEQRVSFFLFLCSVDE